MLRSRWIWLGCFIAILCLWLSIVPAAQAATASSVAKTPTDAQELFTVQCAGCHPGGGNIIRRGKTLKLKALKRNRVDSEDAISTLITEGKGIMSAYGDRLSPEEIDLLAAYVWGQAQTNWRT